MSYILFGDKSTKSDFGLIVAPYFIPMPAVQTNYVQIPGKNGTLDLTEGYGKVCYSDRTITLTLYALSPADAKVSAFVNHVHGKRMNIVFDRDPTFYYTGRITVTAIAKQVGYSTLTVNIVAAPYKLCATITEVSHIGQGNVILQNMGMPVVPEVTTQQSATLSFTGYDGIPTVTVLAAGTHLVPEMELQTGNLAVNIQTTGEVVFRYREGAL